jgi:hypothetical protein
MRRACGVPSCRFNETATSEKHREELHSVAVDGIRSPFFNPWYTT